MRFWTALITTLWLASGALCQELTFEKADRSLILRVVGSGDVAVVATAPGRWLLIWTEGSPPTIRTATLRIENGPPDPEPPVEAEATRLARRWLAEVPEKSRARAPALAAALRGTAADIDAGKLTKPAEIIAAAAERNRAALGDERNAWLPWFESLREYLNGLAEAGKLATPADHATVFRQLAEGLQ